MHGVVLAVLAASAQAQISAGTSVHVSHPFPQLAHHENLAAGDPDHVGRLLTCSMIAHTDLALDGCHCYASFDGGKTWSTVLESDDGPRVSDPAVVYGRGDTVFVMNHAREQALEYVYRSVDGGRQWELAATFPFVDRQGIIVDETTGPFAGRVYVNAVSKGYGGPPADVVLYRSLDGGATFLGPVVRPTVEGHGLLGASNPVVFSDGTLAFTTFLYQHDRSPRVLDEGDRYRTGNAQLKLLTSSDGGVTLDPWVTISESYLDLQTSQGGLYAQLAVDPGSRFFKDRLYVVFPDLGSGRIDIRFAYSTDKGKTWSAPVTVNDDRPPLEKGRGPDHMLPAIGINQAGVVLVVWYDRREFPDNMGWKMRAAASLDGGVTFTPSVPVSDPASGVSDRTRWTLQGESRVSGGGSRPISVGLAINSFFLSGGHTSGMAVGADDVFHPVWTDYRTGVAQLWTAPITVRGRVEQHGAPELADLEDVTARLSLEPQATNFDRSTGSLTLNARLRNTSREPVRGPLKIRVIGLRSQLGSPAVVGAANGISTIGAIWNLDGVIRDRGLPPDSATAPHRFTFRLTELRPIRLAREDDGFTSGLLDFDVRVFGRREPGARGTP